jgi:vacuolar iron transporter family protein
VDGDLGTDDIKRYRNNLRDELDGAALYTRIAAAERDPVRKDLFLQLAWFSAARQAVFGCAAAAVTYGIGSVLGVSLS